MNERFLLAIKKIETSDHSNVVRLILEIFSTISSMNKAEIIAAYQTIMFFLDHIQKNDPRHEPVAKITTAIVNRMLEIVSETPAPQRIAVSAHFERVVPLFPYCYMFKDFLRRLEDMESIYSR